MVIFGEHAETVAASGAVEPEGGYVIVSTSQTGRVIRVMAAEGATIGPTTPLAEVSPHRLAEGGQDIDRNTLELLRQQQNLIKARLANVDIRLAQRKHWLDERLKMIRHQQEMARAGWKSLEPAMTQMSEMVTRYEYLRRQGFLSQDMASQKIFELTALQSRGMTAQQQVYQLERQDVELQAERADLEQQAHSEKLSLLVDLGKVTQAIDLAGFQSNALVTAGVEGRLMLNSVQPGQHVNSGETLFMVAPEKRDVVVRLELLAESMARLSIGQRVNLRYAAFPYQKYGIQTGRITSISGGPVQTGVNGRERPATRGSYRVMVRPDAQTVRQDGRDLPIPIGTPVDADIELANERILDWVCSIIIKK